MTDQWQSYSLLADEYYDAVRHPTCANFRYASSLILRKHMPNLLPAETRACELGAGRSLLAEICANIGRIDVLSKLVITDASNGMLSHSIDWKKFGSTVRQADAATLPYPDGYFDLVVAICCDSYNEAGTWQEVSRVLASHGHCILTVPSYQWALKYRALTNSDSRSAAFELRTGVRILVPSFIYPPHKQVCQMRKAGLYALSYEVVRLSDISGRPISPKLLVQDDDLPVVEGYVLAKSEVELPT